MTTTGVRAASPAAAERRNEWGMALPASLVIVFLLLMLTCTATSVAVIRQSSATTAVNVDRATQLAETGIDLALYEMQVSRDYGADGIGVVSGSMDGGTYSASVTPPFAGLGTYTITATGTAHRIARRVEAHVSQPLLPTGFVGRSGVSIVGNSLVDSYDSSKGSYASQLQNGVGGSDGFVGSDGDINLTGTIAIRGDAVPGPGKAVLGNTSLVLGSITPASQPLSMPPVMYAPPVKAKGPLSGNKTLGTGVYRFTQFNLSGNDHVTFNGDVDLYVDGSFSITGTSYVTIAPTAHVRIFQGTGDFVISGGGIINQGLLPSHLQISSASATQVKYDGNSAFYGSIYAPGAAGRLVGGAGVYGSFRTRDLTVSGGANLHYDQALSVRATWLAVTLIRPLAY
jgi:hypothetical protein